MRMQHTSLRILTALTVFLALPPAAFAEVCHLELDAPALVTLEADHGIALAPTPTAQTPVILEASPTHLVLALAEDDIVVLDGPTGCDIQVTETHVELHRQISSHGHQPSAVATSFHPLAIVTKEEDHEFDPDPMTVTIPTKEEDHEFDPDPQSTLGGPATSQPLLTLIELVVTMTTQEEDHAFDPDPKSLAIPTKEEDHEFDPDPALAASRSWTEDWGAVSAFVHHLGPGWYFVVRGGEVTREIVVGPES